MLNVCLGLVYNLLSVIATKCHDKKLLNHITDSAAVIFYQTSIYSQRMKFVVFSLFLASVNCKSLQVDWTELKPITQIKEYREAYPWRVEHEPLDDGARVFDRSGRIVRGDVAGPTDYPFSVSSLITND